MRALDCDNYSRFASFMSERAGSDLIPSLLDDFKNGLGAQFYIPPLGLQIREDGRDHIVARRYADSIVPPLCRAEASYLSSSELARSADVSILRALSDVTLMRQCFVLEVDILSKTVGELRAKVRESAEEGTRERVIFAGLRDEVDELKKMLADRDAQLVGVVDEVDVVHLLLKHR